MKIKELLDRKGREVVTVRPTATLSTVVHRLRLERIGCVVVSDDGKHIDGIIAVRDIAYAAAEEERELRKLPGGSMLDRPVSDYMIRNVRTCKPADTLKGVMQEMTKLHILHVPVVDKGELCGIVSIDDVVRYAVEEMEVERDVLHDTVVRLQTSHPLGE